MKKLLLSGVALVAALTVLGSENSPAIVPVPQQVVCHPERLLDLSTATRISVPDADKELEEVAERAAQTFAREYGLAWKVDRKGSDEGTLATSYLVFIANRELDDLADVAISWADGGVDPKKPDSKSKKDVKKAFKGIQAVDIALFGRMLADASDFNIDACSQVAHAISVNEISQEYDYFTAVDDCAAEDNAGAGMLGTVSFNSSTLYRYATVNVDALMEQLKSSEATACGVAAFVEAFVKSMPTGKQNTFANRTLPNVVAVSLRDDQPINLATAFERPVYAERERSITQIAAERLAACAKDVEGAFAHPATKSWHVSYGVDAEPLEYFGEGVSFDALVTAVREAIESALASEE